MTRARRLFPALTVAAALLGTSGAPVRAAAPAAGGTEIRRFALVVGSNDGGAGRVRLRFATSDAISISHVLHEMGGLRAGEDLLLIEPDRATLQGGFERLRQLVATARAPGVRVELLFYYSGHSDEDGLLPRGERVAYGEVKRWIEQAGADVRIAILDSCASGALTRAKGGVRRAPFLVDGSSQAQGHAFLTASSADESAQESDRLGAAFFTHYLLSGLRGAADTSRDGRVTLNEAYQYAFHETLARTEQTRAGAQHPTYDFQLTGSGDLVMTDLHGASASLTIADDVNGRVFVRDASGHLVAEVRKAAGHPVELGLEPGRYNLTVEDDKGLRAAAMDLSRGRRARLSMNELSPLQRVATVSRGDDQGPAPDATIAATVKPGAEYYHVPFAFGIIPAFRTGIMPPLRSIDHAIIGFPWAGSDRLQGIALAFGASWVTEDVRGAQLSIGMNYAGADSRGAQAAVGTNLVVGSLRGAQLAVGFNTITGDLKGFQSAVGFNVVRGTLRGGQLAVGFNIAPRVEEDLAQAAVGFNIARGQASGLQLAVGLNEFSGQLHGMQFAVGLNHASGIDGAQIGLLNVGGDVHGAQVGLLNIARNVRGAQVGLLNIAGSSSASVGLLSIVREGQLHLDAWTSEVGNVSFGAKLGGQSIYSLLFVSVLQKGSDRAFVEGTGTDRTRVAGGLGFGLHLQSSDRLYTNVELLCAGLNESAPFANSSRALVSTARLLVGLQLASHLAVFAGPAYNVMVGFEDHDYAYGSGVFEKKYQSGATTVRTYPSLVLGIQI